MRKQNKELQWNFTFVAEAGVVPGSMSLSLGGFPPGRDQEFLSWGIRHSPGYARPCVHLTKTQNTNYVPDAGHLEMNKMQPLPSRSHLGLSEYQRNSIW